MIGSVIHEQYLIQGLLGEGGMGVVYKALDQELDRPVALKLLKGEFSDNQLLVKRFRDELRVLANFNHPNITTLHTSFTWQGRPVMVMELLEGETFSAMIRRRGPIPAHICVPLVLQALAGVGEAHRRGIIHRDLKPANLMLNLAGVVKVMDFGIAKIEQAPGLTRTTTVMGTPYYMAPEQVDPERFGMTRVDYRTDIYAMGVTLYELLAGEVPFKGASEFSIQRAHLEQEPQSPTVYYPHIPQPVVDAVLRAMAKDPRNRFQNAEEFAKAFDSSASASSIASQHPVPSPMPQTAQSAAIASSAPSLLRGAGTGSVPTPPHTPLPATVYDPTRVPGGLPEHNTGQTPIPVQPASTVQPDAVSTVQVQSARPLEGSQHRWFGSTGRPWVTASAVAALVLLLFVLGGLGVYAALNRTTEPQPGEHALNGGGGGNGGGASSSASSLPNNLKPHAGADNSGDFHLPRPAPAVQTAVNSPLPHLPTTPKIAEPTPVHDAAPTPSKAPEGLVAGRWTGSYTSCADSGVNRATMLLSESSGTDESKLLVSGRLLVSTNIGQHSCAINGTFMKKTNRLILQAACGSTGAPEYLSAAHTSLLSLYQDQLSGTIHPDSPCVTILFKKM